jgi:hypothetical protein
MQYVPLCIKQVRWPTQRLTVCAILCYKCLFSCLIRQHGQTAWSGSMCLLQFKNDMHAQYAVCKTHHVIHPCLE